MNITAPASCVSSADMFYIKCVPQEDIRVKLAFEPATAVQIPETVQPPVVAVFNNQVGLCLAIPTGLKSKAPNDVHWLNAAACSGTVGGL
jgi:hypothetical protein